MNVYLLTNTCSGAQALMFARGEHDARHRRPDGAVWRLGRWLDPATGRIAAPLDWWPGAPRDVWVDPVLERIDSVGVAGTTSVLALKTPTAERSMGA